ncbi:MAG: hypothetical protein ACOYEN_07615 [Limnochordia bacterium]|jgi:hypothetical protein
MLRAWGKVAISLVVVLLFAGMFISPSTLAEGVEEVLVQDFSASWAQAGWPDANSDEEGVGYQPAVVPDGGPEGEVAVRASFLFKEGGYSQGVMERMCDADWRGFEFLEMDVYLEEELPNVDVQAKLILFPEGRWTEASDLGTVTLQPGQWVTITAPLSGEMTKAYWGGDGLTVEDIQNIKGVAVKLFAAPVPSGAKPINIRLSNGRISRTSEVEAQASLEHRSIDDFDSAIKWGQADWACANKDAEGLPFRPRVNPSGAPDGGSALTTQFLFKEGAYSQGVIDRQLFEDWRGWQTLQVDIYLDQNATHEVFAKMILFPSGRWTEADDMGAVTLRPGEWVTLSVPLIDAPEGYWGSKRMGEEDLQSMAGWAVKVFSIDVPGGLRPVEVRLANAQLIGVPKTKEHVERPIANFTDVAKWSQADWAPANRDPDGKPYKVMFDASKKGPQDEPAVYTHFAFKEEGYSQGIVDMQVFEDWRGWDYLEVDLYLEDVDTGIQIKAKPVLFPSGRWTEAADMGAIVLQPGEWVTLKVPIGDGAPEGLWGQLDQADLESMTAWAMKVFATNVPQGVPPVEVRIANPRLTGEIGGQRAVEHSVVGVDTYEPKASLTSVGTFGSFGKGTGVLHTDSEGLLTFNITKDAPVQTLYWPTFYPDGSSLDLGSVELAGTLTKTPKVTVADWVTGVGEVCTEEGGVEVNTKIMISRAFPAVLYQTEASSWKWTNGLSLDYVAYVDLEGQVASVQKDETLPGSALGAPWLLLWNHPESGSADVLPMLIRLERRPTLIQITGKDVVFSFPEAAGSIGVMPLYGIMRQEGEKWLTGMPKEAREFADFWSRALACFPKALEETAVVDDVNRVVTITNSLQYHMMQDEWSTEPIQIAPVPPVVMLAQRSGYPVKWIDGAIIESNVGTFFGPYAYRLGEELTYQIPIPSSRDQMLVPISITNDPVLEKLQSELMAYVWQYCPVEPRKSDTEYNGSTAKTLANVYPLLGGKERILARTSLPRLFDPTFAKENLQTIIDPTSGQQYVMSNKVWVAEEPFDREWYNGRQLDWTWVYAYFYDDAVSKDLWKEIQGLYAYYQIFFDWAWSGTLSSVYGFTSLSDGICFAYEGMLGAARLAKMVGDDHLWQDASYRAAKQALSIYAAFDLPQWIKSVDYAVQHDYTGKPTRRQAKDDVLTEFGIDGYFEWTGAQTQDPRSLWSSTNWLYWNNPAQLRLYAEHRFEQMYEWEFVGMPGYHPNWYDANAVNDFDGRHYGNDWSVAHVFARGILFGEEPLQLKSLLDRTGFLPHFSFYAAAFQSIIQGAIPQVWAPVTSAKVSENQWDGVRRTLTTKLIGLEDGPCYYEWTWRNPSSKEQIPGPERTPAAVYVNGTSVPFASIGGGFYQVELALEQDRETTVEVVFGQ